MVGVVGCFCWVVGVNNGVVVSCGPVIGRVVSCGWVDDGVVGVVVLLVKWEVVATILVSCGWVVEEVFSCC